MPGDRTPKPGAGLDAALELASRGISVFPIVIWRPKEKAKWEKAPIKELAPHGHLSGSTDPAIIKDWATKAPDCRWGALAAKFVLLDLDGDEAVKKAESLGLPPGAVRVPSARKGGFHIYLQPFPGAGSWAGRVTGIDSRGGGTGWAVVYASFDPSKLPAAPEWFQDVSRWGEPRSFPVGTHDVSLARICGRLWNLEDADEESVLLKLSRIGRAQADGEYTYTERDLMRIVRSIGKRHARTHPPQDPPAPPRVAVAGTDDQRSPWSGRPGWDVEKEIPIRYDERLNRGTQRYEHVPREPAYVIYNELIQRHHLRSFRTRNQQLRVAVPGKHGLRILDPVPNQKGQSTLAGYLRYHFYIDQGEKVPGAEITKVSEVFAGRAATDDLPKERVVDLSLRIAPRQGLGCILDLRDDAQRCVVVGPEGWRVEETGRPIFDVKPHMLPLPLPKSPPSIADGISRLFQFLLLPPPETSGPRQGENQRLLFVASLVQRLLMPRAPKPAHVFTAGQNVGKTTGSTLDQAIFDPSQTGILPPPTEKDMDDYLRTLVLNRSTVNFDNVSHISRELSDALCRLITGTGIATRKKYSDSEEVIISATPQVIINGITATPEAADLLRRCILFRPVSAQSLGLLPLDPSTLWERWEAAHPEVLGALLDLACAVARELTSPQDPSFRTSSHMQAFYRVGQAVAKVLGSSPAAFVKAFEWNLAEQGQAAAQTVPVQALLAFWRSRACTMPATSADIAEWIRGSEHSAYFTSAPTPHSVGKLMDRSLPTLEQSGIFIEREVGHASQLRWVRKEHPPTLPPLSTGTTPPTPPLESYGVFPPSRKGDGGVVEGLGGVERPTPPAVEGLTPPSGGPVSATPPSAPTSENPPNGGVGGVGGVVSQSGTNAPERQVDFREVMRAAHNQARYLSSTRGRGGWWEKELVDGLTQSGFVTAEKAREALRELIRMHKVSEISTGRYRAWS